MTAAAEAAWRRKVAAELRGYAAAADELADEYDKRFAGAPAWSAAATCAPAARARAAETRARADRLDELAEQLELALRRR